MIVFPEVEPVPDICGVESEIVAPLEGYVISGASGAVVSIVIVTRFPDELSLETESFSVA